MAGFMGPFVGRLYTLYCIEPGVRLPLSVFEVPRLGRSISAFNFMNSFALALSMTCGAGDTESRSLKFVLLPFRSTSSFYFCPFRSDCICSERIFRISLRGRIICGVTSRLFD